MHNMIQKATAWLIQITGRDNMKKLLTIILLLPIIADAQKPAIVKEHIQQLTSYVNPFIGTAGTGHTFPGATLPFGMVQLSPDTRTTGWENCSGYHSSNPTIIGFSHTHLSGTGAADYGDVLFMATIGYHLSPGNETIPFSGYRSTFSHDSERASPGYYRVMLKDYNIQAEMTATTRCGFQKYTFPESDSSVIVTDLVHGISDEVTGAELTVINDHAIAGFRRSKGWAKDQLIYFYSEFSKPFGTILLTDDKGKKITGASGENSSGLRAFFLYKTKKNEAVYVKTGISTVSVENAKMNLDAEIPAWDYKKTILDATVTWNQELQKITVEGGTSEQLANFYTALYHVMLTPNIMSDTDGRYRGMDNKIHKMENGHMYTVFSLWDTFRALHPLFTVIDEKRAAEFVRALLQKYKESGLLPVWELASNETNCMIGYHAVPVIADAYLKGINDFDTTLALEAMKKSAMQDKLGLKYYKNRGYIPADKENESVSKALEYAYDDWCIAQVADRMNKKNDAEYFFRRSGSYINSYDAQTGFMRGKKNGNWVEPFDPFDVSGIYTEANAWQYKWFVPHDVPGLMKLMGGSEKGLQMLDTLFKTQTLLKGRSQPDISGLIGQYAHGNEPSHHMSYLYNFTGAPYRCAELCRKIMNDFYHNERDGLIGNEDCGQMSAWYVFSAMGFYPVCPGDNSYYIGSPVFRQVTVNRAGNKPFIIKADSSSEVNIYPYEAYLDDQQLTGVLPHSFIRDGGTLTLKMKHQPSSFFSNVNSKREVEMVMIPYLKSGEKAFVDSCLVEMHTYTNGAAIYYTLNGEEPTEASYNYKTPFYINSNSTFKIKAFKKGMNDSFTEEVSFIKLPYKMKITYTSPYSYLYTAGGMNGLLDGQHGDTSSFGGWQGFHGDDFEAVIDLGTERSFSSVSTTWLQQYSSWIWLPTQVEYMISEDGKKFKSFYNSTNSTSEKQDGVFIKNFVSTVKPQSTRYLKIKAANMKVCPSWHSGAGEKAWIFIDEIEIN
jgi:predicted alpha-1,2-mannosidase